MALLLNILWFVLGGLVMGLAWWLVGLICALTKAARNSWELPTSQVQPLVVVKPCGATFSKYVFSFRPSRRHGQETSWRVER
jgi:Inner membrane component domain